MSAARNPGAVANVLGAVQRADTGSPPAWRPGPLITVVLVVLLTAVALWIRLSGLQGWDGTLSVDESRLAMAARGVRETGLPQLPSGWIYTRGLLVTYLTAASLLLLGPSDFAARLPAVLAGVALIPVAYLLGREVAGRPGGLFVAAFLAGHQSFVVWSRQAWFYAEYVLLVAVAILFMLRANRTGRARDQILAGCCVGLSAFTHEIGIFLLAPLAAQAAILAYRGRTTPLAWVPPFASTVIVGVAGVVLWLLVTRLRAESMVGAYGEIDEYLSPAVEWSRIRFYLRMLADGPGFLLFAALAGLPFAIRHRCSNTLILWLALLPAFVHAAFLIPRGPQERYGLTLVLVIAVLGVQGVSLLVSAAERLLQRFQQRTMPAGVLASVVLAVLLLAHQDVARAVERAALSPRDGAWLRAVRELDIGPDDLVMTDVPTTIGWYIDDLDFWVSSRDYEKYTSRAGDVRRDVHTGAVLVRSRSEMERLMSGALAGRTLWVIASGRSYQWGELVNDDLKALVERSASQRVNSADNFRVLVLDVPSGS